MDTTVQALKNLYAAMGGTAADVANLVVTPDLINALCSVAGGSGTSLLEVEGTLTQVESSLTLALSNVTGADLYSALVAGKKVKMTITDASQNVTIIVADIYVSSNADEDTFNFGFAMQNASLNFVAANIGATDAVVFESQA